MNNDLQKSYDQVAEAYAREFRDELVHKPFDRKMLDWLVEKVGQLGRICDLGCGPGHVARYLHDRGADVCGIDLSPEMVRQAALLHSDINFTQGDMLRLDRVPDESFGGVAAFYSVIHIPRPAVVAALAEIRRVLRPNGVLLLTHHIGSEIVHRDEFLGQEVSMDFIFFETEEMKNHLVRAGFMLEEVIERDPYPGVEYQSRRAYIFAHTPGV
ncbi:MAG TPA: class I SAM-dependent methyltransferase [Pyrinomonadaceae bacterium]